MNHEQGNETPICLKIKLRHILKLEQTEPKVETMKRNNLALKFATELDSDEPRVMFRNSTISRRQSKSLLEA